MLSLERAVLKRGTKKDKSDEVRWPALISDKNNYGIEHHEPVWWLTTDRRREMTLHGKQEVVDRKAAIAIHKRNEEARAFGLNRVDAYEDSGDF